MLSFGTAPRTVAPPCLSTRTRSDRHFPDLAGACAKGRKVLTQGTTSVPAKDRAAMSALCGEALDDLIWRSS